jgi:hypothetical protein
MSLRGNGKTIGGVEDRLGSAQDRLSEVDGSCSLASSHKRMRKLTVNKTKSSLVQVGSQGVRVDKSAIMSVLVYVVET